MKKIALWEDLDRRYNDMKVLFEFAEIGEVEIDEIRIELKAYKDIIDDLEIKLFWDALKMNKMLLYLFILEQEEPRAKIGLKCFSNV